MAHTLSGVTSGVIATTRLEIHYREAGPSTGIPVVLIHGNASASGFWEDLMLALPGSYRLLAPDLRGYGDTEGKPIDATRGLRDWSEDIHAFAAALGLGDAKPFHIVGWSMGGGIAMQYAVDYPTEVLSLGLIAPLSPFGFGGTKGNGGAPCFADFAGSGGGTVNAEFVQRLSAKDTGAESPNSPRNVMNAFYFKPPFKAAQDREDAYVDAMNSTRIGDGFYPGDLTTSTNWPSVAPGKNGINNAMAPSYVNLAGFADIRPQPPVLWLRGDSDLIVSDTSFFDLGFLGSQGWVPGWPGADVYPPQPMIGQTRFVFDQYAAKGGRFVEVVVPNAGHSPHIEQQALVAEQLTSHWASVK
ncbi:MAG: alpha/beta fold hydrolase [Symbiobacteriia bacterium]